MATTDNKLLRQNLARAEEALAKPALEPALDFLLGAWGCLRAPELAELIEVVSLSLQRGRQKIEGETRKAHHERWMELESKKESADLPRLLEALRNPPCKSIAERLGRLEARPPDPRLSEALVEMINDYFCSAVSIVWTRIFRLVERQDDPRIKPALARRVGRQRYSYALALEARLFSRLRGMLPKLKDEVPLPVEHAVLVERLRHRASALVFESQEEGVRLLTLVFSHPEESGPQQIYADWLIEQGDPRGEVLSRHLQGSPSGERERALLHRDGLSWVPIAGRGIKLPMKVPPEGVSYINKAIAVLSRARDQT